MISEKSLRYNQPKLSLKEEEDTIFGESEVRLSFKEKKNDEAYSVLSCRNTFLKLIFT